MRYGVIITAAAILLPFFATCQRSHAAMDTPVNYPPLQPILDSDLDGLTNEGEQQKFATDPHKADTDNDGWLDGAEILNNTNPLNSTDPSAVTIVTRTTDQEKTPWAWYITRGSGLIAFAFSWVVIFLGIAIRLPGLRRILSPVYSLSAHHVLAFQTIFFAFLHGLSFSFDAFFKPSLADIFIPFWITSMNPLPIALGILALYGMVLLAITSWIKPMIPFWIWRATHFLNILIYGAVIAHALLLGTDLRDPTFRFVFISINAFLGALFLANILIKILSSLRSMPFIRTGTIPASENK